MQELKVGGREQANKQASKKVSWPVSTKEEKKEF